MSDQHILRVMHHVDKCKWPEMGYWYKLEMCKTSYRVYRTTYISGLPDPQFLRGHLRKTHSCV